MNVTTTYRAPRQFTIKVTPRNLAIKAAAAFAVFVVGVGFGQQHPVATTPASSAQTQTVSQVSQAGCTVSMTETASVVTCPRG